MGLCLDRRAPLGPLSDQPDSLGQGLRTAATRFGRILILAPVWSDLSVGLHLVRRTGAGADRQPWHPAAGRTRRCRDSSRVLGRSGLVAAADLQSAAAPEPVSFVRAVSVAALWRTGLHDLPVGHVPVGRGLSRAAIERRSGAGTMVAALAAVPLHAHVRRRQAAEPRSQLVEPDCLVI